MGNSYSLNEKVDRQQSQINSLKNDLKKSNNKINSLKNELSKLNSKIDTETRTNNLQIQSIKNLNSNLSFNKTNINKNLNNINKLRNDARESRAAIRDNVSRIEDTVSSNFTKNNQTASDIQGQISVLTNNLATLDYNLKSEIERNESRINNHLQQHI